MDYELQIDLPSYIDSIYQTMEDCCLLAYPDGRFDKNKAESVMFNVQDSFRSIDLLIKKIQAIGKILREII